MNPPSIVLALSLAREKLLAAQVESAALDSELLLAHVLRRERYYLHLEPNRLLTPGEEAEFTALIARRAGHEPLAYILGRREFYSLDFIVKPGVLIPRPETELLVDLVLDIVGPKAAKIADVGCGSGAISCAIAQNAQKAQIWALDVSPIALEVSALNVKELGLSEQVTVQKSDLLQNAPDNLDIIVSNPPYIPENVIPTLMPEVQKEPILALSGGEDGLIIIKRLIDEAARHLKAGGSILIEHGYDQASAVQNLLQSKGFTAIASRHDLADIARVTMAKKPLE